MSDEEKLSGEEKRRRLKEIYKADYRKRKQFLQDLKKNRRVNKLNQAMQDLMKLGEDDSEEWIRRLNQESALNEAKYEMASESTGTSEEEANPSETPDPNDPLAHLSALEKIKVEMGLLKPEDVPRPEEANPSGLAEDPPKAVEKKLGGIAPETGEAPTKPQKSLGGLEEGTHQEKETPDTGTDSPEEHEGNINVPREEPGSTSDSFSSEKEATPPEEDPDQTESR